MILITADKGDKKLSGVSEEVLPRLVLEEQKEEKFGESAVSFPAGGRASERLKVKGCSVVIKQA